MLPPKSVTIYNDLTPAPHALDHLEIKAKLRRAASHLQGKDTSYFSRAGDADAIRLLYRLADQFTNPPKS